MAIYIRKEGADILRAALQKLERDTSIKAIGPGSVVRAFTEAVTTELSDLYDILDFNMSQNVLSSASGRALDLMGSLYGLTRRTLSDLATIDRQLGVFYFYIDAAYPSTITIPSGTQVYTDAIGYVGQQMSFTVTETSYIAPGQLRVFVPIRPNFTDSVYTAASGTLTSHSLLSPPGVIVKCFNPKPISPQDGFEDDETFRLRISKSIRTSSNGTAEALRFTALSINGVRDVVIRTAPYGMGTLELILTPETDTQVAQMKAAVDAELRKVKPVGVRLITSIPVSIPFDISVGLIMTKISASVDDLNLRRARVGILRYLNTLLPGDPLVYNRLVQSILDSSEMIQDIQITRYAPNGVETTRRNYTPELTQQVIPGRIEVTAV